MAQKLFADSNRAALREAIEATDGWGEVPVSGVTRARRFTTSSLTVTKDTAVSEEIRDDRMVSSVIETAASSGGEVNWEFAAGTTDLDYQRALMGTWSRPMTFDFFRGKHISIGSTSTILIAGDDVAAYFTAGRRIKLEGFTNLANNDYFQITSAAFSTGVTTVTISTTTLVVEAGADAHTVFDANDVIILKSTAIRSGTGGADTFDSNGGNVFAAARAAGQLVSGQRIYVEGTGYETGTIVLANVPADGETIDISDGVVALTFEFQTDLADVDPANVGVLIGVDVAANAVNLNAAVNAQFVAGYAEGDEDMRFMVVSKVATATLTLTNLRKDGGTIVSADAGFTETDFSGGNATHGGFYTILAVTDDTITVDRDVPTVVAGKAITIKGSILRNPGNKANIIPQSMSLETSFTDIGQNFVTDGLRVGGVSQEVTAGSIVTGSTTTMGRETKRSAVQKFTGGSYTPLDAAATEVVSATANVGALQVDGAELSTAIQSIQFSIEGNLRAQQAVGAKFPVGIAAGRLNITGTVTAYFADGGMYDQFLNHDTVSLAFPIIDADKNTYWFTIPAFKITSDPVAPGGTDQDVMEAMEFTAFRDAATKCMMQIDRFSPTTPKTVF